jgi:cytoskeleton protein RodZ
MESAGARLKQARLEKGYTLDDAHRHTKIHLSILKAIEEDAVADINPVYLKGFIKIYCQFLGVNPQEYAQSVKDAGARAAAVQGEKQQEPNMFMEQAASLLRVLRAYVKPSTIVTVVCVILAFFLTVRLVKFIAVKRAQRPSVAGVVRRKPVPQKIHKAVVVTPQKSVPVAEPDKTVPQVVAEKPAKDNAAVVSGVQLGIRTREDSFILVKTDGRTIFQGILKKGRFETWQAKDSMNLSIGNAGAVELEVNGKIISDLGRRGQSIKNITITKDGLKIGR